MIRYVALAPDDGIGVFAWFDTVRAKFNTYMGSQTWATLDEFLADYDYAFRMHPHPESAAQRERYIALHPDGAALAARLATIRELREWEAIQDDVIHEGKDYQRGMANERRAWLYKLDEMERG